MKKKLLKNILLILAVVLISGSGVFLYLFFQPHRDVQESKTITEEALITVSGSSITIDVEMDITLGDYGIAFKKGKPSTNIAKTVKATIKTVYN